MPSRVAVWWFTAVAAAMLLIAGVSASTPPNATATVDSAMASHQDAGGGTEPAQHPPRLNRIPRQHTLATVDTVAAPAVADFGDGAAESALQTSSDDDTGRKASLSLSLSTTSANPSPVNSDLSVEEEPTEGEMPEHKLAHGMTDEFKRKMSLVHLEDLSQISNDVHKHMSDLFVSVINELAPPSSHSSPPSSPGPSSDSNSSSADLGQALDSFGAGSPSPMASGFECDGDARGDVAAHSRVYVVNIAVDPCASFLTSQSESGVLLDMGMILAVPTIDFTGAYIEEENSPCKKRRRTTDTTVSTMPTDATNRRYVLRLSDVAGPPAPKEPWHDEPVKGLVTIDCKTKKGVVVSMPTLPTRVLGSLVNRDVHDNRLTKAKFEAKNAGGQEFRVHILTEDWFQVVISDVGLDKMKEWLLFHDGCSLTFDTGPPHRLKLTLAEEEEEEGEVVLTDGASGKGAMLYAIQMCDKSGAMIPPLSVTGSSATIHGSQDGSWFKFETGEGSNGYVFTVNNIVPLEKGK